MAVPTHNSNCLSLQLHHAYSFKRCCFFFLIILLSMAMMVGVAILTIVFILKPQKPVFSLQTMSLESYKLDVYSNSTLFISSVISLTLNAQNPNKVGLGFSPSRLDILYKGLPIGVIHVPGFYLPAHSYNVLVKNRVLFPCVNVSQIISEVSRQTLIQMRILGDIGAHVRVFHITLPKIKLALDCNINIDYQELTFKNELYAMAVAQNLNAAFPANFQTFSKNCSVAFLI
ncbi:hypothetical protein AAG906_029573 [Vitis piasezkii]